MVAVVVTGPGRDALEARLEQIERSSGKGRLKWRKAEYSARMAYLEEVGRDSAFAGALFARVSPGKAYQEETAAGTAAAAKAWMEVAGDGPYRLKVVVDGLKKGEKDGMRQALSRLGLDRVTAQGSRDESSPLIRLADALAGLVREAEDGDAACSRLRKRLARLGSLAEV